MDVKFEREGQIRLVKHGYSWQVFFFGWLVFFFRGQPMLAVGHLLVSPVLGAIFSLIWTPVSLFVFPSNFFLVTWVLTGFSVNALLACWANRFSARSYVKNDWRPVGEFPMNWNTPPLIRRADRPAA